jgi:hypothetical protein
MQEKINKMPKECQPTIPSGPDPKWRYMWRVGPRPSITRFKVVTLSLPACLYLYNFLELTYFYIKKNCIYIVRQESMEEHPKVVLNFPCDYICEYYYFNGSADLHSYTGCN